MKIKLKVVAFMLCCASICAQNKPNVIFIAIDDLNDWVGCLGGNQQVKTPNIDKFAQTGMIMNKAYAPSTVCCPSRTAILTGKHAYKTGVYSNKQNLEFAPKAQNLVTLPEYFENNGYYTLSTGKIFHQHGSDLSKYYNEYVDTNGNKGGKKWSVTPTFPGIESGGTEFSWGATTEPAEDSKDYISAKWATNQLKRDFKGKPFFLALGISKPHLPWFVPQEFYDMYPIDKIQPVGVYTDDLKDIVDSSGKQLFYADNRFLLADKTNNHKNAQQAYMACVSYVDYCLGQLFDELEKSKYANNTIVVLWGDHGWHLSEKLKYGKTDLWEESCRVPFIVKAPGVTPKGSKTDGVVNLIDMYPTLSELCGLPINPENDGRSFVQLLKNPAMEWNKPTLTTYQYKNHSLTDGRYRYTFYGGKNDAQELYDHTTDPLEHKNLADDIAYKTVIERLKKLLPTANEPDSPKNKGGDAESEGKMKSVRVAKKNVNKPKKNKQ